MRDLDAKHYGDALTWIEQNTPNGIALVARALAETSPASSSPAPETARWRIVQTAECLDHRLTYPHPGCPPDELCGIDGCMWQKHHAGFAHSTPAAPAPRPEEQPNAAFNLAHGLMADGRAAPRPEETRGEDFWKFDLPEPFADEHPVIEDSARPEETPDGR